MARRRSSGRRHRHSRLGFLYKLLAMLAICAAIIVALTLFFKVGTISVTGTVRYTAAQVEEVSGVKPGDNLFLLNKYDIAGRIHTKLPYVETVRINRSLPDTLLISVTECTHTYAVLQDGTAWLISSGGKVVEAVKGAPAPGQSTVDGLTLLSPSVGTEIVPDSGEEAHRKSLLALLEALEKAKIAEQVSAVHMGDSAQLTMDYAGRFTVVMPWGADYPHLLRYLMAVEASLETNQTGTIDLTRDGEPHFRPA